MTGAYLGFKPLVISCLDDNPKNHPMVIEVLTIVKKLKKTSEKCKPYVDIWTDGDEKLLSQTQKQLEQNQQHCQALEHQKQLQQDEQQNYQRKQEQGQQQEEQRQHQQITKQEHQEKLIQVYIAT